MTTHLSRRKMMKGLAGAGIATIATKSIAAPATTQSTQAAAIDTKDFLAMERVIGREFSQADNDMMADGVASKRSVLKRLREMHIEPSIEPAVHFDPRVPGMKLPSGSSSCQISDAPTPKYNGEITSLAFASVTDLSRLIAAKKITSTQLTKMYLDRLKRIGPVLNCVITLTEDLALQQAERADREIAEGKIRSPLHGIPWGAKDLLATKGIRTTWGAKPYIDQVFDYDATVVKKLEEAGAVLCAKLSMGELAMGDVWFNGQTHTPWDITKGSNGSSAGPAAAVTGGLVAFAVGSETMGSIVSPCLVNGCTGLRPTYGRVSRFGAMPLSRTMDKLGPMCRSIEDCALVLSAIAGADEMDLTASNVPFNWNPNSDIKSLRVGYNPAAFDQMANGKESNAKKTIYADALEKMRSIAGDLKSITLPKTPKFTGLAGVIIAAESSSSFTELVTTGRVRDLKQQDDGAWPNEFRIGAIIPAADYLRAMQVRTMLQTEMAEAMKDLDLYINIPYSGPTLAYTNLTGHPTLIARCGFIGDQPIMIELLGNLYREDAILRLAFEYEKQTDLSRKWPNI